MSANIFMDRTTETHYGYTCPLLVVWNLNELCDRRDYNNMKSPEECKQVIDAGCEMICRAILDKSEVSNSLLGRIGARAYRRVVILAAGRSTIWGMPPEWGDMTNRACLLQCKEHTVPRRKLHLAQPAVGN
eukprot:5056982-Amphidinium_carterae.2